MGRHNNPVSFPHFSNYALMRVASISGGRSSAMMLKILIDNGFGSEPGDIVCFCNTGREHNATLDFVQECSIRWNIPIIWLEYRSQKPKFEVVTYETAARRETGSRPFYELLSSGRGILPNPVKRFCTAELKIKTVRRYVRTVLKHRGLIPTFIGLRYDEPTRVARKKAQNAAGKEPEWVEMPLNDMKITVNERDIFWGGATFQSGNKQSFRQLRFLFFKIEMATNTPNPGRTGLNRVVDRTRGTSKNISEAEKEWSI